MSDAPVRPVKVWACPLCGSIVRSSGRVNFAKQFHRRRHRPWTATGKARPLLPVETFA